MKNEGVSIRNTAKALGITSRKVYLALHTDIRKLLTAQQKQVVGAAREMARIISTGLITPKSIQERMLNAIPTSLICRCTSTLRKHYKPLRELVRRNNKALETKAKAPKVRGDTILKYIITGKTASKRLKALNTSHPDIAQFIQICRSFYKIIKAEKDAMEIEEWIKAALECKVRHIRGFVEYIRKDLNAVKMAYQTNYNNALLEGTANKIKAIKRSMYNRANAEVLRAKVIYVNSKIQ